MSDPYLLSHTLDASTSVNCMSFSPTGNRLAVGGEDATIRIWNPQTGKLLHCVVLQSPILCLDWDPLRESRIFFGCQDGTVAYIDSFVDEPNAQRIQTGLDNGQVYAITVEDTSTYVGISIGPEVHIANKLADGTYATLSILPAPKALPDTAERSDVRVRCRALKFMKRGSWLIATYLNHGIVCWDVKRTVQLWQIVPSHRNRHIGSSAISPDGRWLLSSNLDNGMNLYSLDTFEVPHSYQYTMNPETNYPLSVAFLKKGRYVICGTHTGSVSIWDAGKEAVQQTLDHPTPLVTCLAVKAVGGNEYIATATAGNRSYIRLWNAPIDQTFQESIDELWRRASLWLMDNKDDKNAQELGMKILIAVAAFFFARFLYKQQAHENLDTETQNRPDVVMAAFTWMKVIFASILTRSLHAAMRASSYAYHVMVWCWVTFSFWLKHAIKEWLDIDNPLTEKQVMAATVMDTIGVVVESIVVATATLQAEPTAYIP